MFRLTPLVLLATLMVASTGHADVFVTGTENANQTALGGSPDLTLVNRVNGTTLGGYDYGIAVNASNVPTGSTPVTGNFINIITVDQITSYNRVGGSNPLAGFAPNTVTVITAAKGLVTGAAGGVFDVSFQAAGTSVKTAFYSTSAGTYNIFHPATWGATNSAGTTFNTPLALYTMHAATDIVPGPGGQGDFFAAGQVNTVTVNTAAAVQSQGRILLTESNPPGNGGFLIENLLPGSTGTGQFAQITEQLQTGSFAAAGFTAADKSALDLIFSSLLGDGIFNASAFNPSADFSSGSGELSFGFALDPGNFVPPPLVPVPEPTTFAVWGLLFGAGGIGSGFRYYRSKWSRKV